MSSPNLPATTAASRFFRLFYEWTRNPHGSSSSHVLCAPHHRRNQQRRSVKPIHTRRSYSNTSSAPRWKMQQPRQVPQAKALGKATPQSTGRKTNTRNLFSSSSNGGAIRTASPALSIQPADSNTPEQPRPDPQSRAPNLSDPLRSLLRRLPHPVTIITASHPIETPSASSSPSQSQPQRPQPQDPQPQPPTHPESQFRGMTISSLTCLTLHPKPHVTFNIRIPSSTYTALSLSGHFLAHILSSTPSAARIASAFAKGGGKGAAVFRELVATSAPSPRGGGKDTHEGVEERTSSSSSGIHIYIDPLTNAPLITSTLSTPSTTNPPYSTATANANANPILQILRCRHVRDKEVRVGDHVIVVGEVVGMLDVASFPAPGGVYGGGGDEKGINETHVERLGLLYVQGGYRYVGGAVDLEEEEARDGDGDGDRRAQQQQEQAKQKQKNVSGGRGRRADEDGEVVHRTLGLNIRRGDEGMGTR